MMWRWARSSPGAAAEIASALAVEVPEPMDTKLAQRLQKVAQHQTLTLTHFGRKTGNPYKVTIWFVVEGDKLYLVSADTRRSWTRNVAIRPNVKLEVGAETFQGAVEPITYPTDREHVMRLVQNKYWYALPFLLAGRFLQALGIVKDHTGAFEVKLSG